ncbi:MAG: hypothetical protein CMP12_20525 [Zunongwangia sp.]|nr:hypothetical protein [Zunongwangia sp.]
MSYAGRYSARLAAATACLPPPPVPTRVPLPTRLLQPGLPRVLTQARCAGEALDSLSHRCRLLSQPEFGHVGGGRGRRRAPWFGHVGAGEAVLLGRAPGSGAGGG